MSRLDLVAWVLLVALLLFGAGALNRGIAQGVQEQMEMVRR